MDLPQVKTDTSHVKRVIDVNQKATIAVEKEIDTWNSRTKQYEDLRFNLVNLPKETSHQVMVPFGSCAFMPGKLTHTNEILVLLGDNWFVERSAFQALEIVQRRLTYCQDMLKKFSEERKFYDDKIKAVERFSVEQMQLEEDTVEITEYEDSNLHTFDREKAYENMAASSDSVSVEPKKVSEADYLALMKRMDVLLEREEREENGAGSSDEEDEPSEPVFSPVLLPQPTECSRNVKRVKWSECKGEEATQSSPESTVAPPSDGAINAAKFAENNAPAAATSTSEHSCPKSILKNRTETSPINANLLKIAQDAVKCVLPGSVEAFSGIVMEKPVELSERHTSLQPMADIRKPSKFKVQRSQQQ